MQPQAVRTSGQKNYNLWADYIYLDTDERRRFAQVSHEYLSNKYKVAKQTLFQEEEQLI